MIGGYFFLNVWNVNFRFIKSFSAVCDLDNQVIIRNFKVYFYIAIAIASVTANAIATQSPPRPILIVPRSFAA